MVKTWSSESSSDKSCSKCGSIYSVTMHRFPTRDNDTFNCQVCGNLMDSWNSTTCPMYELKLRKETYRIAHI